jgi:hypothetical protein
MLSVNDSRRICDRKRATVSSSERDFDDGMLNEETYLV